MDDDQQFCLRWNNHQSTLVAVFDTLLENEKLVDCTLAAEGKFLNAHKVVLSACSPYFESLLSRHYDKHPILILKDVKFQELKAMMDYMYRGEVNISQDQLGALLKAAESLQIKGLSDNKKEEPAAKRAAPAAAPPKSPQTQSAIPKVQGLTIEQRSRDEREGSISPGPRKKKRMRRKSEEMDNHHDASNSSDAPQNIPSATTQLPVNIKMNNDVPDTIETKQEILRHKDESGSQLSQVPMIKEKLETHTELMLEPKSEYADDMNEDSIEDLTLDDDDLSNMEQQMDDGAGPSHGGEGSSQQGFGHWQMGNQSQDEVFLAAQEAVGAHRDSQGTMWTRSKLRMINPMVTLPVVSDDDNYADLGDWLDISVVEGLPENSFSDPKPSCDICKTVFKNSTTLNHHLKNRVCQKSIKAKKRKCPRCAKSFNTITGYQYHIEHRVCNNRISKIGTPKCPQCYKVFTTPNGLAYHQKKRVCTQILPGGPDDDQIMTCTNCQAAFDNKASMLYHVTHNVCLHPARKIKKRKTLRCPLCPKKFRAAISLKRHLRNQQCFEGVRPAVTKQPSYQCQRCQKSFACVTGLEKHEKRQVCMLRKTSLSTLRKVQNCSYQCGKCSKVFSCPGGLDYHLKRKVCEQVKQRGPPFCCNICGKSFGLKQLWSEHIKEQSCHFPEDYMQSEMVNDVDLADSS
ncbi:zinc finger and BTB domain-containing protein 17-like isoform X3 [Euwallacea fornicatus]|uniref:zinc finger and BTB domain-containing protein 17-like isoform X3 n=1 Tax=Euwallacea fornicatus TaxID=995702 RepID=UPI00338EFB12